MGKKTMQEKVGELQSWALPTFSIYLRKTDPQLHWHFCVTELLFSGTSHQCTLVSWQERVKSVSYWVLEGTMNNKEALCSSVFSNSSKNIPINSKSVLRFFFQVRNFERTFTMAGRVFTHSTFMNFYNLYYRVTLINEWNHPWSSWDELIPLKFWEHWSSLHNIGLYLLNGHKGTPLTLP